MNKVFNLTVKKGADGSKHLDLQIHGVIDGGWWDEPGVDTKEVIARLNEHADAKTVHARINSVGGSVFGGVALYNALQAHPGDVRCTVEGLAASAASLVAMAGTTCMGVGSMLMIHPPLTMAIGNAAELRKNADVLDKIQDALASIYATKTGKSLDEINALVDDETWMTADEAVAAGFADEIADGSDDEPEAEPDVGDPDEGDEHEPAEGGGGGESGPELRGAELLWRGVAFPVNRLPGQIVAMAAASRPPAKPRAPVLAIAPPPAPEVAEARDAGYAAGVAAERARLQAIDELEIEDCADLVAAAKYGAAPMDAAALAVQALRARRGAGVELLARRRAESAPIAAVMPGAPDQTQAAAEARAIANIVAGGNSRRGGNSK